MWELCWIKCHWVMFFARYTSHIIIPPMLRIHFPLHVALTTMANGRSLGTLKKQCCFGNRDFLKGLITITWRLWGIGGIACYILCLVTLWSWMPSYSPQPAYPSENTVHRRCTYWTLDAPQNQSRYGGKVKNSSVLAAWPHSAAIT